MNMQVQPLAPRKPVGLYIVISMISVFVVILGVLYFVSLNSLQQTRSELGLQKQETWKYKQLSEQYASQVDEKTKELARLNLQLDDVKNELKNMITNYDDVSWELEKTNAVLKDTASNLAKVEKELELYKETYGSVVASGIAPPFRNVHIVNQTAAVNTTWSRVQSFILADPTDRKEYIPGVYVCGEFASDVHNNAELAGIRCALVAIEFQNQWHACNAFLTTDRGLVFVDCTGVREGEGPNNCDKTVVVKLGGNYIPVSMVPQPYWEVTWEDMGVITDVQVYW